jgi:hypothetical protein
MRAKWAGGGSSAGRQGSDPPVAPAVRPSGPDHPYERPVVTDKGPLANLTWAAFAALDKGFRPRPLTRPDAT